MNYTKYDKETQRYMKDIQDYLVKTYGEYQLEWDTILTLLADNISLYIQCKESIRKNGIYNAESGRKNPLLSTCKDLQATILKQIQHLGLSPYAVSKIRLGEEDDTEDFVDNLTK